MPSNGQKPTAEPYKLGTNKRLDRIIPEGTTVFIVQGRDGRRPIGMPAGSTAADAIAKYLENI